MSESHGCEEENPKYSRSNEGSIRRSQNRRNIVLVVWPLVAFSVWGLFVQMTSSVSVETAVSLQTTPSNRSCHAEGDEAVTFGNAISTRLNWTAYDDIPRNRNRKWKILSFKKNDGDEFMRFARQVYFIGFHFATMEPKKPIDSSCKPPALATPPPPEQCSSRTSNVFNGIVRARPRKVGHAIQLGFDIDTLEIHLRELVGVVDKFFIIEWTMPHNRHMNPKPLAWDAVKGQDRFAFALDKVVHFVMDDIDTAYVDPMKGLFDAENLQEQRRWERIAQWNGLTKFFGDEDLIGFGDTDEIPSRQNVHLLKHCEWTNDKPVDVGIWFPMGRIHQAFRSDFPVRGHPYSLGDPTFHVFGSAKTLNGKVSRNRGKSPNSIIGGAHFSQYGYLVYNVMKLMSCTECRHTIRLWLDRLRETVKTGDWIGLEERECTLPKGYLQRIIPISQLPEDERNRLVYLPWFYDCNRDRYPRWEGRPDCRTQ